MKKIILCLFTVFTLIAMKDAFAQCPSSHPVEACGQCWEDCAQAASGGCTNCGTATPTCSDGIQNGNETGVDCGGSCPSCPTTPTCSDGIQNGNETGIDCGGSCQPCAASGSNVESESGTLIGSASFYNDGAASGGQGVAYISSQGAGFSLSNVQAASAIEVVYASELSGGISIFINGQDVGNLNFSSTGSWVGSYQSASINVSVPAGSTFEMIFQNGDAALNVDYVVFSGSSNGPSCTDGIQNGDETGVDCGGSCPNSCPTTPSCSDGIQNGDETGVDCGGSCPNSCSDTPSCSDGIQNGDETGVDCGGSCIPCNNGSFISGKFTPTNGRTLLTIGQDLNSVRAYANSGYFPTLGGATQYTNIYDLAGLETVTNYGAGDICLQCTINEFPNSILAIGLYMVEDNDGVGNPDRLGRIDHPNGLTDVVNGLYDIEVQRLADFFNDNSSTPIFLRIGYEFDGPWNAYDPQKYINAYRYLVDFFNREGVDNVAYIWQSATWGETDPNSMTNWFPGSNYVDYLGISFFFYDENFNGNNLQYALDWARSNNTPIMMAEVSAQYYEFDQGTYHPYDNPGSPVNLGGEGIWNQYFVDQLLPFVKDNNDVIRHVAYINADWQSQDLWEWPDAGNGFWGDTRIEANSYIRNQWANELNDLTFWLHGSSNLLSQLEGTASLRIAQNDELLSSFETGNSTYIYPNAVSDILHINGVGLDFKFDIIDQTGRILLSAKGNKADVSNLKNGIYFLRSSEALLRFIKN